jgi:hypothetical protein
VRRKEEDSVYRIRGDLLRGYHEGEEDAVVGAPWGVVEVQRRQKKNEEEKSRREDEVEEQSDGRGSQSFDWSSIEGEVESERAKVERSKVRKRGVQMRRSDRARKPILLIVEDSNDLDWQALVRSDTYTDKRGKEKGLPEGAAFVLIERLLLLGAGEGEGTGDSGGAAVDCD